MPFEHLQLCRVVTLRAETETIDAAFAEHLAILKTRGRRIHLGGPFVHRRQIEPLAQGDFSVKLAGGTLLRLSRSYRTRLLP